MGRAALPLLSRIISVVSVSVFHILASQMELASAYLPHALSYVERVAWHLWIPHVIAVMSFYLYCYGDYSRVSLDLLGEVSAIGLGTAYFSALDHTVTWHGILFGARPYDLSESYLLHSIGASSGQENWLEYDQPHSPLSRTAQLVDGPAHRSLRLSSRLMPQDSSLEMMSAFVSGVS